MLDPTGLKQLFTGSPAAAAVTLMRQSEHSDDVTDILLHDQNFYWIGLKILQYLYYMKLIILHDGGLSCLR